MTKDEKEMIRELDLLTLKPILYVANVSEEEAADASGNPHVKALTEYAEKEGAQVITISAKSKRTLLPCRQTKPRSTLKWKASPKRVLIASSKLGSPS